MENLCESETFATRPTELIINPYWKRFLIVRYPREREGEKERKKGEGREESSRWFAQYSSTRLLASSRYKFVEKRGGRGGRGVCEYLQFFSRLLVRLAIALRGGKGEVEGLQCEPSVHFSNDLPSFGFGIRRSFIELWRRKRQALQRFVTRLAIVVACRLYVCTTGSFVRFDS